MTEHSASDRIKSQRMSCRNHNMLTHCHVSDVQVGPETCATAKAEQKNKVASGAVTRRKDISPPQFSTCGSCGPCRWGSGGTRRTVHGAQIHLSDEFIGAHCVVLL